MIRRLALAVALIGTLGFAVAAGAQIAPNDTGRGTQLGMAEQNNSGETGTVTLFRRPQNSTLVVVDISSEPPGRLQPAHIHRGHDCSNIDPKPAYGLAPLVNGVSKTLVQAPERKLLSGNYVVNVHASSQQMAHSVSCGELYH